MDYVRAQKRHGLKAGDKVKVMRKAKTNEKGWINSWEYGMNQFVGKILTISSRQPNNKGFGINVEETTYLFPHFVLRRIHANTNNSTL